MKTTLGVLTLCLLASGCTTSYRVQVSGYAEPETALASDAGVYVRTDPNQANPLFHRQIHLKIQTLLSEHGYRPVARTEARYVLEFQFGGRDRTVQAYRYDVPFSYSEWYHTWPHAFAYGAYIPYTETLWDYWIILRVKDRRIPDPDNSVVWVGEAGMTKHQGGKRQAVDYLLVALFPYFGHDTAETVGVALKPEDVAFLRTSVVRPQ